MSELTTVLRDLTDQFLALHTDKEDRFWDARMGLTNEAHTAQERLTHAEIALNRFLQAPDQLRRLRRLEAANAGSDAERRILKGWIAMFAAHVVEDPAGQKLSEEIVEREQALALARGEMQLGYVDPDTGVFHRASSVKLSLMMRSERDERRRRAAFEGLRSIEPFVLDHGFLEIVEMRNRLGRLLGYEDYYDWKVSVVEQMSKRALFAKLDDLERRTAGRTHDDLVVFERKHGAGSRDPWNFPFLRSGKLMEALDPYFGFGSAVSQWVQSFAELGVTFRQATLTLDLVDRSGKYENGFMHGPVPAFFDHDRWQPARINFTANAVPGQVGSGLRAVETLFHEGGHAAHFANILSGAPCFSQEFAPTSVAYAETQSMFMDSLIADADWRLKYTADASGQPMPMALIEESVRETQALRSWDVRSMLTVPFAERAIYEMTDAQRTPEHVTAELRRIEAQLQGLHAGPRPVLSIPHLLAGESSAYYHGYILAEMAVHQTRAHFLRRDGRLTDNPAIGPDLARHYWAPGNAVPFDDTIKALTGQTLSADALARVCNLSIDESLAEARAMAHHKMKPMPAHAAPLDATIHVIHGRHQVASTDDGGVDGLCRDFNAWITGLEQDAASAAHASSH